MDPWAGNIIIFSIFYLNVTMFTWILKERCCELTCIQQKLCHEIWKTYQAWKTYLSCIHVPVFFPEDWYVVIILYYIKWQALYSLLSNTPSVFVYFDLTKIVVYLETHFYPLESIRCPKSYNYSLIISTKSKIYLKQIHFVKHFTRLYFYFWQILTAFWRLQCGKRPPKASGNFGWRARSTLYSPVWRVKVVRWVGTWKRLPR